MKIYASSSYFIFPINDSVFSYFDITLYDVIIIVHIHICNIVLLLFRYTIMIIKSK